jgi:hypothetical protein
MEDGGRSEEKRRYEPIILRTWLVGKVVVEYCLGEGEKVFSVNNQRYGRWWQV